MAHEKDDHPPDLEWDKPYRALSIDEIRSLAIKRGVSSPLGAASSNKKQLVAALAHADYAAHDGPHK